MKAPSIKILIFSFSAITILALQELRADPIYRAKDEKGNIFYTSKPKSADAKPADLPKLIKAPSPDSKPSGTTCIGHGGVNCQAGADSDGSVICYDNFKESLQRFVFSCSAAKLAIIPESQTRAAGEFTVVVRNKSSVAAKGIKISGPRSVILEGPAEISPHDSASYKTKHDINKNAQFQINCDNCP